MTLALFSPCLVFEQQPQCVSPQLRRQRRGAEASVFSLAMMNGMAISTACCTIVWEAKMISMLCCSSFMQ
jgi:hypothetical protein